MSTLQAGALAPSAPSPTPSNASANGAKRKRHDDSKTVVYSQPAETDARRHIFTQLTYAFEHLQRHPDQWFTFRDIVDYLNINRDHQADLRERLRTFMDVNVPNNKCEYDPATKKYRYRPKYNIRNSAELRQFLQSQKSAQGLSVRDLREGWPKVQEDLRILESRHQILVKHNKNDMNAKTVWANDPTLVHDVDPAFKDEWHQIPIPAGQDDLRKTLLAAGLKPSSAPRLVTQTKPKETKRKTARRGGKQTNTHMAALLKDFSHLRK